MLAHLWTNWRPGDALFVSERAQYPLRYYVECRCGDLPEPARDISWRSAKIPLSRTDQYAPALASRPPRLVVSEAGASRFAEARAVSSLLGRPRVWVLMTSKDAGERGLLTYLSCIGRRTDAFVRRAGTGGFKTAAVYRYDLADARSRARVTARCTGERRDVVIRHRKGLSRAASRNGDPDSSRLRVFMLARPSGQSREPGKHTLTASAAGAALREVLDLHARDQTSRRQTRDRPDCVSRDDLGCRIGLLRLPSASTAGCCRPSSSIAGRLRRSLSTAP